MSKSNSDSWRYVDLPMADALAGLSEAEQAILQGVNQRIAGAESVEAMIDFLFDATREICPCDRIGLALVEEDGRRVVSYYNRTTYEPVLLRKGYAEDLQGSSLDRVIRGGTPRVIDDLEAYHAEHPSSRSTRILLKEGVRSSMTCPLSVDGRNVGLLFRSSRRPSAYELRHLAMHRVVAERLSQAVEKACRIEQLTAANRAYTEMLAFVSHELKSPVASLVMTARMLMDGYYGRLEPAQRDKIGKMIDKGNHLLGLVEEYLDLARLEGDGLKPNPMTVGDFVRDIVREGVEMAQVDIRKNAMNLTVAAPNEPIAVECDPGLMKIAMVNLVSNAAKYGRKGGEIRVVVESSDSDVNVAVWNEGPGFPESQQSRLFRKFSRLDVPELKDRKGTGVGLYTTWRIVHLHGGRIGATSHPGEWAEFALSIPRTFPRQTEPPAQSRLGA